MRFFFKQIHHLPDYTYLIPFSQVALPLRVAKFSYLATMQKISTGEGGEERTYIYRPGLYGPNPFSHCHPPFCGRSLGSYSVQIGLYTGDSRDSIRWVINL